MSAAIQLLSLLHELAPAHCLPLYEPQADHHQAAAPCAYYPDTGLPAYKCNNEKAQPDPSLKCLGKALSSLQEAKEGGVGALKQKTWKELAVLAWPGALNMLSIIVQGMGLQYISASVSQMISGESQSCLMHHA